MRVVRGRGADPVADSVATASVADRVADTGEPALRVWIPHRQVAFGRRDVRCPGYDRARSAASQRQFTPVERRVGGRAVAYTGSTIAFLSVELTTDRTAVRSRYAEAIERLGRALDAVGVSASTGERDASFCPGSHSLQANGKIAGLAQRVRRDVALVGGIVVVSDERAIADVLDPVYEALDVPFDPDSVGSVAAAGGPAEPQPLVDAIIDAFAPTDRTEQSVRDT